MEKRQAEIEEGILEAPVPLKQKEGGIYGNSK